ncbi:PepSY domain-containing protein [Sphingomonas sp. URHD0057]|uniref:PepSY domain-containing protein n=1 Tax=Sphingomonas sp. URHD0057 TaxID=1380389 RepID=UPI000490D589|nr:PepSY domain-containing protein [Sphingomonas sp. URHD0057]
MRKQASLIALVAALGIGTAAYASAPAPKVSKARAEAIALKLAPGKIISSEYENEGGGWRWSFDIQQRGHVQEIGIDGRTGKVVENKSEGKVDHD